MKRFLFLFPALFAVGSLSASAATLFAGWDDFDNDENSTATVVGADTTASMTGTANWSDWNFGAEQGASTDGTFGSLSTTVGMATTANTGGGRNLSLNRSVKPGTLVISLTNTSGLDRTMDGFYFDGAYHNAQAAQDWQLSFSGAISGTAANGSLSLGDMMQVSAADRDKFIDLSGLSDATWEAGSTAIFTIEFTGGATSTGTGGGHETLVDNIGITATVVPEPSAIALFGLGGLALFLRRRR